MCLVKARFVCSWTSILLVQTSDLWNKRHSIAIGDVHECKLIRRKEITLKQVDHIWKSMTASQYVRCARMQKQERAPARLSWSFPVGSVCRECWGWPPWMVFWTRPTWAANTSFTTCSTWTSRASCFWRTKQVWDHWAAVRFQDDSGHSRLVCLQRTCPTGWSRPWGVWPVVSLTDLVLLWLLDFASHMTVVSRFPSQGLMAATAGSSCTLALSGTSWGQWAITSRDLKNLCSPSTCTKSLSTSWVSASALMFVPQTSGLLWSGWLLCPPQVCCRTRRWPPKLCRSAASCCRRPTGDASSFCCASWPGSATTHSCLHSTTSSAHARWYKSAQPVVDGAFQLVLGLGSVPFHVCLDGADVLSLRPGFWRWDGLGWAPRH